MLVLDTNHFSELRRGTRAAERLRERLAASDEEVCLTIVSAEEILRGWLAEIRRHGEDYRLIEVYRQFQQSLEDFGKLRFLPWTEESAKRFASMRRERVRVGTQDLRIASITLAHNGKLLTRNLRDFQQTPGLVVDNWLD